MAPNLKSVAFVNYASSVFLSVALCLGLSTRWLHSEDVAVVFIAFVGLFVFSLSLALVYYFSLETFGFSLLRLWVGCLLGIIMFTEPAVFDDGLVKTTQKITNWMLVSSVFMHCVGRLLVRLLRMQVSQFQLFSFMDLLEMVGLVIASVAVGQDSIAITCLMASLFLTIITIKLKSVLGLLNFICIVGFANVCFFRLLNISLNSYAFLCFVGRLSFEPMIDWYFIGLTLLQRWNSFLVSRPAVHKLLIAGIFFAELGFLVIHSVAIRQHKEWYVVVPLFAALVVFWACTHCAFFVTCWTLSTKLSECVNIFNELPDDARNLRKIMTSRGLRCFGLIAQRIVCVTLFSTNLVAVVAWQTKSALSTGMWFVVLPLEICFLSLLHNLGTVLGGTCIGYGIVVPSVSLRSDMKTTVLPPSFVKDVQTRCTQILSALQRFFTLHLIEPFGLDYSSGGLSLEALESKLRQFFQRATSDGPRYDTYLVYYSGPVDENGDWALTGDDRLKLERLLELWRILSPDHDSRLLLILDTEHSYRWVHPVASNRQLYIAIQTWQPSKTLLDTELGAVTENGAFTVDWVGYNCSDAVKLDWRRHNQVQRAIYGVSRSWTDFQFRSPTSYDIMCYWNANFPRASNLLVRLTSGPCFSSSTCMGFECILRCLRRKKMKWLPPIEYDTGHGFKLVLGNI